MGKHKMLIGHCIYNRMVKAMVHASILPITGSMIRTTDYESITFLLECMKKPSKLHVYIAQGSPLAFYTVFLFPFKIK